MRSITVITVPKVYGKVFIECKKYGSIPVILVKAMYGLASICGIHNMPYSTCNLLFTRKEEDGVVVKEIMLDIIVYTI
jgi:hypothetical protein